MLSADQERREQSGRRRPESPVASEGVTMQTMIVIAAVVASLAAAVGAASLVLSVLLRLMSKLR
jgi:hypothetical protein